MPRKSRENATCRREAPRERASGLTAARAAPESPTAWVLQISGASQEKSAEDALAQRMGPRPRGAAKTQKGRPRGRPFRVRSAGPRGPAAFRAVLLLLGGRPVAEAEVGVGAEDQRLGLGVDGDLRRDVGEQPVAVVELGALARRDLDAPVGAQTRWRPGSACR